ncbi:LysM peptidoglycan-binding domain-containing protein [Candidatus Saccharibacteria bacterium]|nr:LysM peptidoglycan-binding domain-containing protein [Candidatus Saccharibacteria bacterium]MCL1962912.1 LysM peptidoglycan-binding domain-containing protein [Candidatus Saccharibacteria bacterium]
MKENHSIKQHNRGRKSSFRRKWLDFSIYGGVLVVLIAIVVAGYHPNAQSVNGGLGEVSANQSTSTIVAEIDASKAIEYASEAAVKTDLAVAPAVSEQSESSRILAMVDLNTANGVDDSDDDIRATSAITKYTVKDGDTLESIAARFDLSAQTIQWANKMKDASVAVGAELTIPIVDGVVYTIKDGDNLAKIIERYKSDIMGVLSINNIDEDDISAGVQLILPGGILPETERPGYVPPVTQPVYTGNSNSWRSVGGYRAPDAPLAAGNTFYYGNCTWYAYNRRIQLGRNMAGISGNANAWAWTARNAGYVVDNIPEVGAIMQTTAGYYGHVAVVESINDDGTITISEMNNSAYGGFGITNYNRITNPYSYTYIH